MGNFFANLFNKTTQPAKIVMIGLNNAGKTTILYKMNLGEVIQTAPTTSFNTEIVEHNNTKFQVWDLAGQKGIRPFWNSYYSGTNAIIFVIDSSDRERLEIASEEFQLLLLEEELRLSPIVVLANKQDIEGSMTPEEISDILKLGEIQGRDWSIFKTSALKGEGLEDAFTWLAKCLESKSN